MNFGHFILDNLASVWRTNSPVGNVFNSLFKAGNNSLQQNTPFNNLIGNQPDIKDFEDLDRVENAARENSIRNQVTDLRLSGWQVDSVDISDRASILAKTEEAMALAMKNGTGANSSGILNQTSYGRTLVGYSSVETVELGMSDKREVVGEDFILNTGIRLFEFQGTNATAQAILQARASKGFSITNAAKDLQPHKSIGAANQKKPTSGTYAIFEQVTYKYSYDKNLKTHSVSKLDLHRNETGNTFIAKKLEIKNQSIDLSGAEYIYANVEDKVTNQPYRFIKLGASSNVHQGFLARLIASKNEFGELADPKVVKAEIANFFRKSGAEAGKFSIIGTDGQKQNFILTKDFELLSEEEFVFSQMSKAEQEAYKKGNEELFEQMLKELRENQEVKFK